MSADKAFLPSIYTWLVASLFFWVYLACVETAIAVILQCFPYPLGTTSLPATRDVRFFIVALSLYSLFSIPAALILFITEKVLSWIVKKAGASSKALSRMDCFLLFGWGLLYFKWISNLMIYVTNAEHLPKMPYLLIVPLLGLQCWLLGLSRGRDYHHRLQWIVMVLGAVFLSKTSYDIFISSPFSIFSRGGLVLLFVAGAVFVALSVHCLLDRILLNQRKPRGAPVMLFIACLSVGLLVTFNTLQKQECVLPVSPEGVTSPIPESAVKKNMIVIVVDCLRADHLGCYGYARKTSPFIDAISRSGVLFEQCVSPSSWTIPAVVSLFTSLYPQQHRINEPGTIIPESIASMQEILQAGGMNTAAFITNNYLEGQWGFARGFDHYFECYLRREFKEYVASRLFFFNALIYFKNELFYPYSVDPGGARWWSVGFPPFNHERISAERITDDVLNWLGAHGRSPFYLYVHYMDVHSPYDTVWYPLFDSTGYDTQNDKEKLINIYDGRIVYVDRQLERIWNELERLQLSDNTLFVITSDHGEELYDHGGTGHCTTLYDELVRVPLIMYSSSFPPKGLRVTRQVQLLDLPVTILDYLGMEIPEQMEGRSLLQAVTNSLDPTDASYAITYTTRGRKSLETEEGRALWEKKVWDHGVTLESLRVDGEWKLIVGDDGQRELYNLKKDKSEQHDLAETENVRGKQLKESLEEITSAMEIPVSEKKTQELSPQTKEQLKALGYL